MALTRTRSALLPWMPGVLVRAPAVVAESVCSPAGIQTSGSIYRTCMPTVEDYNGSLIIWAHGFQDATESVGIPEDQLSFGGLTLLGIANGWGFGFETNSCSKNGLAIVQGRDDILDLVDLYTAVQGPPENVFLIGGSEVGIITAVHDH